MKISRLVLIACMLVLATGLARAQLQSGADSLAGTWSGSLVMGRDTFAMTFNITWDGSAYGATFISQEMGIYGMPAKTVELNNNRILIEMDILAAEYTGRIRYTDSGDAVRMIDGEWFQEGEMVPVVLQPATSL